MTTQSNHPGRAVLRTVFAVVVALATLIPVVATHVWADAAATPAFVVQAVTVAGLVTRVLALPIVETYLQKVVPWLSAAPAPTDSVELPGDLPAEVPAPEGVADDGEVVFADKPIDYDLT